jgi:SAM-dependent methyltransferase
MSEWPGDDRPSAYDDLHHRQLLQQEPANRHSAQVILERLFARYRPSSALDVGCGIGTWLAEAQKLGVPEIAGIEGDWLDRGLARIPAELIRNLDLEKPFDLGRKFDLVICLEVAEHLSPAAAEPFVASLAAHSDVILFSAAIPGQGGHHHVNEQYQGYWARRFARHGFRAIDCIRRAIWSDASVLGWLRQNILVYAKAALAEGNGPFAGEPDGMPSLDVVHPELYAERMRAQQAAVDERERLLALLASGKDVTARRDADGRYTVTARERGAPMTAKRGFWRRFLGKP